MATKKRLIDANALEAHFHETKMIEIFPYWKELSFKTQSELVRFGKAVKEIIQKAPTVDDMEVVHGRWVALDDDCEALEDETETLRWGCTACHEIVEYDDWTHRTRLARFCPNCGAKMDGGVSDGL